MDEENTTISSPLNNVHMDIDLNFEDKQVIGKGTYATVYKCQLHGTDIAVKVFQPTATLTTEVKILRFAFPIQKSSRFILTIFCALMYINL